MKHLVDAGRSIMRQIWIYSGFISNEELDQFDGLATGQTKYYLPIQWALSLLVKARELGFVTSDQAMVDVTDKVGNQTLWLFSVVPLEGDRRQSDLQWFCSDPFGIYSGFYYKQKCFKMTIISLDDQPCCWVFLLHRHYGPPIYPPKTKNSRFRPISGSYCSYTINSRINLHCWLDKSFRNYVKSNGARWRVCCCNKALLIWYVLVTLKLTLC